MADTKRPELSIERFALLVEAYGSDLERFPTQERAAAKALVLRTPEARRMLEAARALDVLLASARDAHDTVELESALGQIPERHRQVRLGIVFLPFRSRRQAGIAAAAAVALGLLTGQFASGTATDDADEIEQASVSLTFADGLLQDLTSVEAEGGAD